MRGSFRILIAGSPQGASMEYNNLQMNEGNSGIDTVKLASLLAEFRALDAAGAGRVGHPQSDKRNELLDEMQDVAGLAGKMVMERDILRKAELLLANDRK